MNQANQNSSTNYQMPAVNPDHRADENLSIMQRGMLLHPGKNKTNGVTLPTDTNIRILPDHNKGSSRLTVENQLARGSIFQNVEPGGFIEFNKDGVTYTFINPGGSRDQSGVISSKVVVIENLNGENSRDSLLRVVKAGLDFSFDTKGNGGNAYKFISEVINDERHQFNWQGLNTTATPLGILSLDDNELSKLAAALIIHRDYRDISNNPKSPFLLESMERAEIKRIFYKAMAVEI